MCRMRIFEDRGLALIDQGSVFSWHTWQLNLGQMTDNMPSTGVWAVTEQTAAQEKYVLAIMS